MPFVPNPIEFRLGDEDQIVTFVTEPLAPAPWSIKSIKLLSPAGQLNLNKSLWSLLDLTQQGANLQATLHFDFPNISQDPTLDYFWNNAPGNGYTVDFNIRTEAQFQELLVTILP